MIDSRARTVPPQATVLAVDDRPANLVTLEAVLSDQYNVLRAYSGAQAISVLQKTQDIDLILLDVQMPGMDGFETAARIKAMPACQDIPIIFITAFHKEEPYVRQGYDAGGIDYFSKPFDPEILKKKIAIYSSFRRKEVLLKERERRVSETEELLGIGRKLATAVESLPVGVLITDMDGKICQVAEALPLRQKAPAGHDACLELLGWWGADGHLRHGPLIQALRAGESSPCEPLRIAAPDGTVRTILASTTPLRGTDNHIVGAAILVRDVTEKQQIETDLEQRAAQLIALAYGSSKLAENLRMDS